MGNFSNITKLIRNRMKASFGVGALIASLFAFTPAAKASCERTVYNKSDSSWVISVGKKYTSDELTRTELKALSESRKKVVASSHEGWKIIVYPNETRRIHYDNTYYAGTCNGRKSDFCDTTISMTSYPPNPTTAMSYNSFQLSRNGVLNCGYVMHDGNTGPLVTVNQPADGDIIFHTTPEANCVHLFTEANGKGKKLNLCGSDHNWKTYTNLGSSGDQIHSHHYKVKSFQCGSGIDRLVFVDGNRDSVVPISKACNLNKWNNVDAAVTKAGTGVGVYK